jgi:hypothetical protein
MNGKKKAPLCMGRSNQDFLSRAANGVSNKDLLSRAAGDGSESDPNDVVKYDREQNEFQPVDDPQWWFRCDVNFS